MEWSTFSYGTNGGGKEPSLAGILNLQLICRNSLFVRQDLTTARRSGNIFLTYSKAFFLDECWTRKAFKYVNKMLPLFRALAKSYTGVIFASLPIQHVCL